jgi:hypothetical protein
MYKPRPSTPLPPPPPLLFSLFAMAVVPRLRPLRNLFGPFLTAAGGTPPRPHPQYSTSLGSLLLLGLRRRHRHRDMAAEKKNRMQSAMHRPHTALTS